MQSERARRRVRRIVIEAVRQPIRAPKTIIRTLPRPKTCFWAKATGTRFPAAKARTIFEGDETGDRPEIVKEIIETPGRDPDRGRGYESRWQEDRRRVRGPTTGSSRRGSHTGRHAMIFEWFHVGELTRDATRPKSRAGCSAGVESEVAEQLGRSATRGIADPTKRTESEPDHRDGRAL